MRVILLGCPGAGKGTQAKFIRDNFHIPQIATGDILRTAISQGTELGKKVKEIVESGHLVPDEIVIQLVQDRIKQPDCKNGFLLDGFPRTIAQANALHKITPIDYVIEIVVPEEEVINRLTGRWIHPGSGRIYHTLYHPPRLPNRDDVTGETLIQRPDDQEDAVRKRLTVYQAQTSPLRHYYQQLHNPPGMKLPQYFQIDGTKSVEEVKKQIFLILSDHNLDKF